METRHELRCFCSRHPKLAEWGRTDDGSPYVHIRIYKQSRIFGEVVVTDGTVDICCRECLRWTTISLVGKVEIKADQPVPSMLVRV